MRRTRLQALVVLVAVFGLGALSGAFVTHLVELSWISKLIVGPPEKVDQRLVVWRMERYFGLSDEQSAKILAILESHDPEVNALRREFYPQLSGVRTSIQAEIRTVLTAEQQALYDPAVVQDNARFRALVGLPPEE